MPGAHNSGGKTRYRRRKDGKRYLKLALSHAAVRDRLLHHVHIVHTDGQSYRLREISELLRPKPVAAIATARKEAPAKSA